MTTPPQEAPPQLLTDEQKAEQYARQIREHLEAAMRLATDAQQLALHHQHNEAARRYGQVFKHADFAKTNLGHAETADLRGYRNTEE
ncbi:hypothetical protein [Archangium lansingense]|uniref:Uncharacterized protein n=1 Tax=Archangium lansingense TaxID=2995310 RepID=A0ABT4ASG8_9BACT|nr:hypothetical protein [Archangium lansinium]MCY1083752.1 hypothetical protein [Archangium lansinium]